MSFYVSIILSFVEEIVMKNETLQNRIHILEM